MIIGAHVSAAGGISNAIYNANHFNIKAIQIFVSPPRNWRPPKITPEEVQLFKKLALENKINDIFLHAIYLVNLTSSNQELINKSKQSLVDYLNASSMLGSKGVIFHPGNTEGKSFDEIKGTLFKNINEILEKSDPKSILIVETTAGQKNSIGKNFEEIKTIINNIKYQNRIAVCLDTAHTFQAGYDWVGLGAKEILRQFDKIIGLKYLKVIHANDSKSPLGSHFDRHENIGQGKLGNQAFKDILHQPSLKNVPFILETPGFENKGADEKNIALLNNLAI